MKILNILFAVILFNMTLFAAPALNRVITFTQPDGTQFTGIQRGDASFHWIESDGDIVIYNPKDKYYYRVIVDKEKGLIPTTQKMGHTKHQLRGISVATPKQVQPDATTEQTLHLLHKKAREADRPR